MSVFGFVSLFIAIVCIAVIIVHSRVMRRRSPVDVYFSELETLLRERTDMIFSISAENSLLQYLCDQCINMDFVSLYEAMPEIDEAFFQAEVDNELIQPPEVTATINEEDNEDENADDDILTKIKNNYNATSTTISTLNTAIDTYNTYITTNQSAALMSKVLGLSTEEPLPTKYQSDEPQEASQENTI